MRTDIRTPSTQLMTTYDRWPWWIKKYSRFSVSWAMFTQGVMENVGVPGVRMTRAILDESNKSEVVETGTEKQIVTLDLRPEDYDKRQHPPPEKKGKIVFLKCVIS